MFYAQFVLAKKGPLAKVWLAAHWEKKLTKAQIFETDVPQAIQEVIQPKVKMALRTVGHLLLGIVRVYSRKAKYLLADTNEAYLKMKVNFRDGFSFEADLPLDIDENLDMLPDDYNITVQPFNDADYNEELIRANMSRLEDITLKEVCNFNALFPTENADDGFGDNDDYALLQRMYGSVEPMSVRETPQPESLRVEPVRAGSIAASNVTGQLDSVMLTDELSMAPMAPPVKIENETGPQEAFDVDLFSSMIQAPAPFPIEPMEIDEDFGQGAGGDEEPQKAPSPESFSLELDDQIDVGAMDHKKKRARKPRKLLIDAVTMISDDDFREQQLEYKDTMKTVAIAPPTREMQKLCVSGTWQRLMSSPGVLIGNRDILKEYDKELKPRRFDPNFSMQESSDGSLVSGEEHPYADLELDEHVNEPAGPVEHDEFFDDVVPEAYEPEAFDAPEPIDFGAATPPNQDELQNKENEEELEYSDPFGSSRGRLEDYGFGVPKSAIRSDEGKWAKRAEHILKKVNGEIESHGHAEFSQIVAGAKNRKQAAEQFYSLLTLLKEQAISVEQAEPFGEIFVRPAAPSEEIRTPMKPIH